MMPHGGPDASDQRRYSPKCVEGNSPKSTYRMLHGMPLWERRMAYFPALELIAKHKIWEH
jgi:hypothetical protein